ncbi:MAG: HAMP domain-containing histidine kinase, partial [Pseudonocardia sp.]|nr:HAMP domain-containing histidine kinase [Pseudonocardia sp.]
MGTVTRVLRRGVRAVGSVWLRSLHLRVVGTTLVMSCAVLLGVGQLLVSRINAGLLESKVAGAIEAVQDGQSYAEGQLRALGGPNDPDVQPTVTATVQALADRPGRAAVFDVVLEPAGPRVRTVASSGLPIGGYALPPRLVEQVVEGNQLTYQFAEQSFGGEPARPYLVVGAPVQASAGSFALYYFFPLEEEEATLALVQRTLITAGALLILLLVVLAAIVTRQVVTPVRLAARAAERLSAGRLEERMVVRGSDDLARLAQSFNRMADSLQRQIVQLEDLSRLQRRFTSDVSHELRTPLTTVRMAADVLYARRAGFRPEVARSAELLQAEVDRFESLLTDLLEISRVDAGMAVLDPDLVDVGVLVARTAEAIGPLAATAGSELRLVLPDVPVLAEVDPRRVERILRNLLGNAIEHGEARPVTVTVAGDDATVAVTVRDLGLGLAVGEAELVFNRFWRADPSRARRTGGTGLGLSIS